MNADDLTFGVEIETTIPTGSLNVGPHGMGHDIPTMPGWKADRDPSIRGFNHFTRQACEFVSPVFKGAEGLRQLLADLAKIKAMGASVNSSCGLHIHVGFDKTDAVATAKLLTLVANFEKAIFASTGTKRRERGRWCMGHGQFGNVNRALDSNRRDRYRVANFATPRATVEFRAFGATLNACKLVGYLRLCLGLVERSLKAKKVTNWTAKTPSETSPIHRGGEGLTAMNRLFYQLGWTKGRQSYTFGNLEAQGAPGIQRTKKEFVRLARKYDASR